MRTLATFVLCTLFTLASMTFTQAELLTEKYGVNISDANDYKDNINLYQLFNDYFADQLGSGIYSSSNDLFNARGVDPSTDWTTNNSQLVGAFKVATLGHQMTMYDSNGNFVTSLIDTAATPNIGNAITDLSGQKVVDIDSGLHVNFQLDAFWGNSLVYSWSSNSDLNDGILGKPGDGMIHMIALDITDLYNAKYGTENESVYMFGWEDLHKTAAGGGNRADWDYQDFVAIMTNVRPTSQAATPEPATALIFLIGSGAVSVVAWRKRKQNVNV